MAPGRAVIEQTRAQTIERGQAVCLGTDRRCGCTQYPGAFGHSFARPTPIFESAFCVGDGSRHFIRVILAQTGNLAIPVGVNERNARCAIAHISVKSGQCVYRLPGKLVLQGCSPSGAVTGIAGPSDKVTI